MAVISVGCDNCNFLSGKRCKLWQVKVENPNDAHCESWQKIERKTKTIEKTTCSYCLRTTTTAVKGNDNKFHAICPVCNK